LHNFGKPLSKTIAETKLAAIKTSKNLGRKWKVFKHLWVKERGVTRWGNPCGCDFI